MSTEIKVGQIWYDGSFRQVSRIEKDEVHYFFGKTIEEIESREYPITFCERSAFLKDNNLHKEANEQFKFQVGDVVKVHYLYGEHKVLSSGNKSFPLAIKYGELYNIFTEDERYSLFHELPVLTIVRRPKKEMTFDRIKSEGIKKLKDNCGIERFVGCFSPSLKSVVMIRVYENGMESSSLLSEQEIKD